MTKDLMYKESSKSLNAGRGCLHDCVYCYIGKYLKRIGARINCDLCMNKTPHFHPEALENIKLPKELPKGSFVFCPSLGDWAYFKLSWSLAIFDFIKEHPKIDFLLQSKDPKTFKRFEFELNEFENIILGTTLETDYRHFSYTNPSKYTTYSEISKAPFPQQRLGDFIHLDYPRKGLTIEPILDFNMDWFLHDIKYLMPLEFIYIGYDNHGHELPEPPLEKTMILIKYLEKNGYPVRRKTLRKAWYEK